MDFEVHFKCTTKGAIRFNNARRINSGSTATWTGGAEFGSIKDEGNNPRRIMVAIKGKDFGGKLTQWGYDGGGKFVGIPVPQIPHTLVFSGGKRYWNFRVSLNPHFPDDFLRFGT